MLQLIDFKNKEVKYIRILQDLKNILQDLQKCRQKWHFESLAPIGSWNLSYDKSCIFSKFPPSRSGFKCPCLHNVFFLSLLILQKNIIHQKIQNPPQKLFVQFHYFYLFQYASITYDDKMESKVLGNLLMITINFWTWCWQNRKEQLN